jgi:hypothetical protein
VFVHQADLTIAALIFWRDRVNVTPVNPEAVKAIIETAFAGVKFPSDENLLRPNSYDESEVRDFVGKNWQRWQDIPKEVIEHNYSSLPFFSTLALIFLLPAYMSLGLEELGSNTATFTVYRLRPLEDREYFLSWTALLTSEQTKSINLFLHCAQEYGLDGATEALQNYWGEVNM